MSSCSNFIAEMKEEGINCADSESCVLLGEQPCIGQCLLPVDLPCGPPHNSGVALCLFTVDLSCGPPITVMSVSVCLPLSCHVVPHNSGIGQCLFSVVLSYGPP